MRQSLAIAVIVTIASALTARADVPGALPVGWGNAVQGVFLFKHRCSSCHSEWDTYDAAASTGSCFIDPARMFHYVKQTMPFGAAGTLKDAEVYALVAYVLEMKKIIKRSDIINAKTLPNVVVPNEGGVISSSCPKEAGGLGKGNVTKDSPKTMPALLPASSALAAPSPPAEAKAKPTKMPPTASRPQR